MNDIAAAVGWIVIAGVAAIASAVIGFLVWELFPAKVQFSKNTPSHIDTPYGPQWITLLAGLSGRRKGRWFFGLMVMKDGESPRARVLAKKA